MPRGSVDDAPAPLDHGLSEYELPDQALVERIWRVLSRWAVPVMMTLAYIFLAATSDTNATGKAWMAVGLGLVMIVWFVFRSLAESAALSRALSVGDTGRLFGLAARHLPHTRRAAARARLLVGRGLAHLLRGEFAAALAAVEPAQPAADLQPLAAAVRIAALVELGRPVDRAGAALAAPGSPAVGWLVDGQLALRAGDVAAAAPLFARVIDDMRAGGAVRAIAHVYAARIADAQGDPAAAARHRTAAAGLASPDAAWLRS